MTLENFYRQTQRSDFKFAKLYRKVNRETASNTDKEKSSWVHSKMCFAPWLSPFSLALALIILIVDAGSDPTKD